MCDISLQLLVVPGAPCGARGRRAAGGCGSPARRVAAAGGPGRWMGSHMSRGAVISDSFRFFYFLDYSIIQNYYNVTVL